MKEFSIKSKAYGTFALLALIVLISGMVIFQALEKAEKDAGLIDTLGRQRMLAQVMGKSVFGYAMATSRIKTIQEQIVSLDRYINQMRESYTRSVVVAAQKAGLELSMGIDGETHRTIPYPATLTRMVNEAFAKGWNLKIDIISEAPVNPKQTLKTPLDREANVFLKNNPDRLFSKTYDEDEKLYVGLYTADRVTAPACASCHSAIMRKTLKTGDILGIRKYQMVYSGDVAVGQSELHANLGEYERAEAVFEKTLAAVRSGGEYPVDLGLTEFKRIDAVSTPSFQEKIVQISEKFKMFTGSVEALTAGEINSSSYRKAQSEILAGSNELGDLSDELVKIYREIAAGNQKNMQRAVLISGLCTFFVLIGVAGYLSSTIIRPIENISSALSGAAKGNLIQDRLRLKSEDEVGILTRSYNKLMEELQTFINRSEEILSGNITGNSNIMEGDFRKSLNRMRAQAEAKQKAESALKSAHEALENKVKERTSELLMANNDLVGEISKRREMEASIKETNNFLRSILETPHDVSIVSTDLEKNVLYWNKGAENMLGYTAEEMIGRQSIDILYPEDKKNQETIAGALNHVLKTRRGVTGELQEKTKDGRYIWVKLTLSPRLNEAGEVIGMLGIGEDISSRKKAEEDLKQSEERARLTIDHATAAFISIDESGGIREWNLQSESIFGWSRQEAVGQKVSELIIPESLREAHEAGIKHFLETGESAIFNVTRELTAKRRDGGEFPVEISISPLMYGDSYIFNAFIQDISERKLMEVQLGHAQKMESIGQLSAGIAHEINTPLQFIGDNIRFLQDSFDDILPIIREWEAMSISGKQESVSPVIPGEEKKVPAGVDLKFIEEEIPLAIQQTLEGVGRVTKIVSAMKAFAHPGPDEKVLTDLNQAIQTTLEVSKNEWKYLADVVTHLDPGLPLVQCFSGDMNQVILNLVVNAAHAIEEKEKEQRKGTITITTQHKNGMVAILVEDTGAGIPQDVQPRIFDPFFTTKEVGRGTGQGLSIIHALVVKKHLGEITFSTEVGKGTVFRVRLPVSA